MTLVVLVERDLRGLVGGVGLGRLQRQVLRGGGRLRLTVGRRVLLGGVGGIELVRAGDDLAAVHAVDGDLRLARGETVAAGMALVQGYELDDLDAVIQINFDLGEGVLAVPESLILKAADEIRARG